MSAHTHECKHRTLTHPRAIEVCDCGATRYVTKGVPEPWHACELCAHPMGHSPLDAPEHE